MNNVVQCTLLMTTYMFLVYWFSQQTDYCGYCHHYNEQDDAKV